MDFKKVVKTTLKVAGAFTAAAGVVALGAVVASGAAAGSLVEGFKAAGKTMKKVLGESDEESVAEAPTVEEAAEKDETAEVETESTGREA